MTATAQPTASNEQLGVDDIIASKFMPVATVSIPLSAFISAEKLIEIAQLWIDSERETFTRDELDSAVKQNFYEVDEIAADLLTMKLSHKDDDGFRWLVGDVDFVSDEDEYEFQVHRKPRFVPKSDQNA